MLWCPRWLARWKLFRFLGAADAEAADRPRGFAVSPGFWRARCPPVG